MGIIGDNKFGISTNGAVNEFIVIGVCLDEMEKVGGLHFKEIRSVDKSLDYGFGQDGRGVLADDFLVLAENFSGYAKFQRSGQEICPDTFSISDKNCLEITTLYCVFSIFPITILH